MQFWVHDKGKFCPFFRKNFLLIFDTAIIGSGLLNGEILSIFPEELFADFRLRNFGFMRRGNSVHFSGRPFADFRLCNFGFMRRGNSVHFSGRLFC